MYLPGAKRTLLRENRDRFRIGILSEEGFPSDSSPQRLTPEWIKSVLDGEEGLYVLMLDEMDLSTYSLVRPDFLDLVILPYGESFPVSVFQILRTYLQDGGCLLTTGGRPFWRPLVRADEVGIDGTGESARSTWKEEGRSEDPYDRFLAELGIKYYEPEREPADFLLDTEMLPGCPEHLGAGGKAFGLTATTSSEQVTPEPPCGNVFPERTPARGFEAAVTGVDRYGEMVSSSVMFVRNWQNGSRWCLIGNVAGGGRAHPLDPDWHGAGAFLKAIVRQLASPLMVYELHPGYACYRQGEEVVLCVGAGNFSRDSRTAGLELSISAEGKEQARFDRKIELGAMERKTVTFAWKPDRFSSDLYAVQARLYDGELLVGRARNGFVVWDEEVLERGPSVRVAGEYFRIGEKGSLFTGVNYYESSAGELMWLRPNVDRMARDLEQMSRMGINYLRPHYHHSKWFRDYMRFANRWAARGDGRQHADVAQGAIQEGAKQEGVTQEGPIPEGAVSGRVTTEATVPEGAASDGVVSTRAAMEAAVPGGPVPAATLPEYFEIADTSPIPSERSLRIFDAIIQLCQKYGIVYGGDLFTLVPEEMGDPRGWLWTVEVCADPDKVAVQVEFLKIIGRRYKDVPGISWDLWNEPDSPFLHRYLTGWVNRLKAALREVGSEHPVTVGIGNGMKNRSPVDWDSFHGWEIPGQVGKQTKPFVFQELWMNQDSSIDGDRKQRDQLVQLFHEALRVGGAGFVPWSWTRQARLWNNNKRFGGERWDDELGCCVREDGSVKPAGLAFQDLIALLSPLTLVERIDIGRITTSTGELFVQPDRVEGYSSGGFGMIHLSDDRVTMVECKGWLMEGTHGTEDGLARGEEEARTSEPGAGCGAAEGADCAESANLAKSGEDTGGKKGENFRETTKARVSLSPEESGEAVSGARGAEVLATGSGGDGVLMAFAADGLDVRDSGEVFVKMDRPGTLRLRRREKVGSAFLVRKCGHEWRPVAPKPLRLDEGQVCLELMPHELDYWVRLSKDG